MSRAETPGEPVQATFPFEAVAGAYSRVVGGGVHLIARDGRMLGQVAFLCRDDMLRDRALQERLSRVIADAINADPAVDTALAERVRGLEEKLLWALDWMEEARASGDCGRWEWGRDDEYSRARALLGDPS